MKKHKCNPRHLRSVLDSRRSNDEVSLHIWIKIYTGLVNSHPENLNIRSLDI